MKMEKHIKIFDLIAPIYSLFFRMQVKNYQVILDKYLSVLDLPENAEILDIGCGTGALSYCFALKGFKVTGVDASDKMIYHAEKLCSKQENIHFQKGDFTKGIDFPDRSFDLVFSSYVAHGFDFSFRQKLFNEAKRLSKKTVLYCDYNNERRLMSDIMESMEGGDYFNFIKNAGYEMKKVYAEVNIIKVYNQTAFYICRV
jgi:ubiquinone/menaquinone biosynthesis C-methylase UbiE